jgi:DNA-binding CsgD family transcriptional regulator
MWGEPALPLIGRADIAGELARLTSAPNSPGVIISGAPGVGKTRLANYTVTGLSGADTVVLRAAASGSASGLPLAALAHWLPVGGGPMDGPVERALRGLAEAAAGRRLVLLVDDAHLLDDVSAVVLHQAVLAGRAQLIATVREQEPAPDALVALWRDAVVPRLDLPPLTEVDVIELVLAWLGGPVDAATLRRLWLATAGNPLYLRELLLAAQEAGTLACRDGVWHLMAFPARAPRLTQLLRARLAGLASGQRELLELTSVAEPIGLALLAKLADPRDIEALERAGLITVDSSGRRLEVRLAHPLYGELLRGDMPAIAALRYNRQVAEVVEALPPRRRDDTLRLAVWRLDGGGDAAPGPMLAAAAHADLAGDAALAERLTRRAYESGGGSPAAVALALALSGQGRHDEAERVLDGVPPDSDEVRVAVAFATMVIRSTGYDDATGALRAVEDALAVVHGPEQREWLNGLRVLALTDGRRPVEAAQLAGVLAGSQSPEIRAMAGLGLNVARLQTGELGAATEDGTRLWEEVARTMSYAKPTTIYLGWRATLLTDLPDLAQAAEVAQAAYAASLAPPAEDRRGWAAFGLARVALAQGRLADAARWSREGAAICDRLRLPATARWCAALGLLAAAQSGDLAASHEAAALHRRYPITGDSALWADNDSTRALAWYAAVQGDLSGARRALVEQMHEAAGRGLGRELTIAALELVRLGGAKEAGPILDEYPPAADWPLGQATVRYVAATGVGPALLASGREFEALGMPLHAAEALALACAALRASGDSRAAARAAQDSAALARACGSPDTPALRQAGAAAALSTREYDIALLAARGDGNKAIAQALFLSERTVENHLLRVYAKLGIRGRAEIAQALRHQPPPDPTC